MQVNLPFDTKQCSVGMTVPERQKMATSMWPGWPVATCVVILGAVTQILLLFEHKLREGEVVSHLDGVLGQPLEDQVIHGVTDYDKVKEEGEVKSRCSLVMNFFSFCRSWTPNCFFFFFVAICCSLSPSVCCLLLHVYSLCVLLRIHSRVCV